MPLLKKDKTIFDFKGKSLPSWQPVLNTGKPFHKMFSEKFIVIVKVTFQSILTLFYGSQKDPGVIQTLIKYVQEFV